MPPKFFWDMECRKCDFARKRILKKITIFRKIRASLVILQNEKRTAHEIGGLALQKKKIRKIVLTMRTTGTNVDFC